MYLSKIDISNFRCFGNDSISLELNCGLTALVGENDAGKSAIIDAIRFALGTTDQEWVRVQETDFHNQDTSTPISIGCKFEGLSSNDRADFLEYLTYEEIDGVKKAFLYINWSTKQTTLGNSSSRTYFRSEVRSGKDGTGPILEQESKELLRATYLRALRDADSALSPGRGSRLSQVLQNITSIKIGNDTYSEGDDLSKLSISGIAALADELLGKHQGIKDAQNTIDGSLEERLSLVQDSLKSKIEVSKSSENMDLRLRQMLEKLNLDIGRTGDEGKLGLGTNNLLYMACELALLEQNESGARILLIEEPEAHLHAQRQLKILKSLQKEAKDKNIQVIVTTHSPLLASVIQPENMVLVQKGRAYSLGQEHTQLSKNDYRFLGRFLDATKANLFFAKGVIIVEGDAENILLPTIAKLIGRDFTNYGVSTVNVGGTGLRRYANIFKRKDTSKGEIEIPVACLTDIDVMPDCAAEICKGMDSSDKSTWPKKKNRRWRAMADFTPDQFSKLKKDIIKKCDGQKVKTFFSNKWTFEYDLAYAGLAKEVYLSAKLAIKDGNGTPKKKKKQQVYDDEKIYFDSNISTIASQDELASTVYSEFTTGTKASKAIAAQYLGLILEKWYGSKPEELLARLPTYIKEAIEYVTAPIPEVELSDESG